MIPAALTMHPLILASGSPRRIELFRSVGLDPVVRPSSYEETVPFPMKPADRAMFFAMGKALDIRTASKEQDAIIVGADTIVVYQDR
ncbi:MAG: Maf family protein, partial [Firmicutes bacterium]|nr:Maf family protein [Bacillota bacterium]